MTTTAAGAHLSALLAGQAAVPKSPLAWLNMLRAGALERANALSVPTTRDEDWRFTDLTPLVGKSFHPATAPGEAPFGTLESLAMPEAAARIVFVDGHYAPDLSVPHSQTGYAGPLAEALREHAALVQGALGRRVECEHDVYAAVNTAWLQQAAVVIAPRGAALAGPVHVVHVATRPEAAQYARLLVLGEEGSDAVVVEEFVGAADASYFVNAVTEVDVRADARIRHVRVQRDAGEAFHIASCAVALDRDARYSLQSASFGARIARLNLDVRVAGPGAECQIDGLAMIAGRQLADTHSRIDHREPQGRSRQLHKCIVGGGAHAVFSGKIVVRPGAQQTDSAQESRNLLVSDRAHVDTKPQLEIFADDVKCAHGATVGQLDAEKVFYLRSRGLDEQAARDLLTYAFAAEVIERMPVESLRERLEADLLRPSARGG